MAESELPLMARARTVLYYEYMHTFTIRYLEIPCLIEPRRSCWDRQLYEYDLPDFTPVWKYASQTKPNTHTEIWPIIIIIINTHTHTNEYMGYIQDQKKHIHM